MTNSDIEPYLKYWKTRQIKEEYQNKQLAKKVREQLPSIIKLLVDEFKANKIILFGSLAKGGFNENSDIDRSCSSRY